MKVVTSISPYNLEIQLSSINSWINLGMQVYSINVKSEIEELQKVFKKVIFIPVQGITSVFGEGFISLDIFLHKAKEVMPNVITIINSDVELVGSKEQIKRLIEIGSTGLCMAPRYNYDKGKDKCTVEKFGFDIFSFKTDAIKYLPPSTITYGKPLWDYWLPYYLLENRIKLTHVTDKIGIHENHERRWNKLDRLEMIANFQLDNELNCFDAKEIPLLVRKVVVDNADKIEKI